MRKHLFFQYTLKGIYRFFISKSERTFLRLSLIYGGKKRYYKTKIKFLGYKFVVPDTRSFLWQFKEIFVEEYYRFDCDNNSPIIYDCGANIGTSCIYFKKLYNSAKVKAFEPDPKIANILSDNLIANNIKDVEIINSAVWVNNNGLELGLEGADGSSIFLNENKVSVKSVRLRNFLEKENRVDFLKMDIEGAEVEVLKDCRAQLNNVQNIFIEFHSYKDKTQQLSEVLEILEENEFRYYFRPLDERSQPFLNKYNKFNPDIDLQLNIFAYKDD